MPCLHGDVVGEGVEQAEVLVGVVADLPVEVTNSDDVEEATCFDLVSAVGQLARPDGNPSVGQSLADLVVDVLDSGEDRIAVFGDDVGGAPECEVTAGAQQLPSTPVAEIRVDPVPGRRREDEVEVFTGRWAPGLERSVDDGRLREVGEVASSGGGKVGADLDAGDPKPPTGEGDRGLPGGASDFEQPITWIEPSRVDHGVEERFGILRPGLLVEIGGRVEGCSQLLPVVCHRTMMARPAPLERLASGPPAWVRRSGPQGRVGGEPLWVRAVGVAGGGVDADPEEVADAAQVAVGLQGLIEDPVFSDELGGHAELDPEPSAADRVESAGDAVVDEEVAVGGGRPFRVAVVEVGGQTSLDRVGEDDVSAGDVKVPCVHVGQFELAELSGTQRVEGEKSGQGPLGWIVGVEAGAERLDVERKRLALLVTPGRHGGGRVDEDQSPALEDLEQRPQRFGGEDPVVARCRERGEDVVFGDLPQGTASLRRFALIGLLLAAAGAVAGFVGVLITTLNVPGGGGPPINWARDILEGASTLATVLVAAVGIWVGGRVRELVSIPYSVDEPEP